MGSDHADASGSDIDRCCYRLTCCDVDALEAEQAMRNNLWRALGPCVLFQRQADMFSHAA